MRSILMVAGLVSLALAVPAHAKPGGHGKEQGKHEQAGGKHKGGKGAKHLRGAPADRYPVTRSDRDGNGIRDRDERYARSGQGCPPGLAKKGNGCLPPGQAKKLFGVGERLPSYYNSYNVPAQYRDRYRDTNEDLFRYGDDGSLYRVDAKTRVIEEVIRLLGR
jgi:hypothetical protein